MSIILILIPLNLKYKNINLDKVPGGTKRSSIKKIKKIKYRFEELDVLLENWRLFLQLENLSQLPKKKYVYCHFHFQLYLFFGAVPVVKILDPNL
jgi:hypothetical protein